MASVQLTNRNFIIDAVFSEMSESFAPVKVQPFDTVYGEFHN